jgi:hypothetical protein
VRWNTVATRSTPPIKTLRCRLSYNNGPAGRQKTRLRSKRSREIPPPFSCKSFYAGSQSEPDQLLPQVVRAATKKLFITDVQGNLFAALTTKPGFSHADSPWWKGSFNRGVGQLYIEDLHFDEQANAYVFSISLPVMDSLRYEVVGVLHRVIDAKEFFSPSTHPIRFGKTGHVMLIDSRGMVLSCPILPTGGSALRRIADSPGDGPSTGLGHGRQ